jgi:mono/diheme cytochrome c family protein
MPPASLPRRMRTCCVLLAALAAGAAGAAGNEATLRFERDGALLREVPLAELRAACAERVVEVAQDPYYGRPKRYLALPFGCVLAHGLGAAPAPEANVFLRARDGYVKPASGARLAEPGAWLAFADADHGHGDDPGWQPIDRRQVDPAPFYLVWTGAGQNDPHRYPWPYQLAAVELAPFESRYPLTLPVGAAPGAPAREGFAIFRSECIACHAINGQGGSVGPELNVPRSIVEYRPAEQIKAYVRDPGSFRYTSMPPHRHLSDAQLDALVAYFRVMSHHKHDPGRAATAGRAE